MGQAFLEIPGWMLNFSSLCQCDYCLRAENTLLSALLLGGLFPRAAGERGGEGELAIYVGSHEASQNLYSGWRE